MKKHLFALLLLAACAEQAPDSPQPVPEPQIKPVATNGTPSSKFDAVQARKELSDLSQCEYDFRCTPFEAVVGYGQEVVPQLITLATDPNAPPKGREVAISALTKIKAKGVALDLHKAAKVEKNFTLRRAYYSGVAATGAGDPHVFESLKNDYIQTNSAVERIPIGKALSAFPEQSMEWAKTAFADDEPVKKQRKKIKKQKKTGKIPESAFATIVQNTARPADVKIVSKLVDQAKDPMARHRLAAKAIELGNKGKLPVLYKGLNAKDAYDRSDAANQLAKVCDKIPADQKVKFIKRLQAAEKKDKGGLTKRGYHTCLKVLGAGLSD